MEYLKKVREKQHHDMEDKLATCKENNERIQK